MPRRTVRAGLALVTLAGAVLVGTAAVATAGPSDDDTGETRTAGSRAGESTSAGNKAAESKDTGRKATEDKAAGSKDSGRKAAGDEAAGSSKAGAKAADACFTWKRDLAEGASGNDVKQLQVRVGGYPAPGSVVADDGEFGPATKAAVTRFQKAYGLKQTGKGDAATYNKIYALQDDDCSPAHFSFGELNNCNSDWSGGNVSAATAKQNAVRTMWKLEALRHALGDKSIRVTSGFRSKACNDQVGGAPSSRHLFGDSADLGAGPHSLCTLAKEARNRGFNGILGPGFPAHDDHTHLDHRGSKFWDASDCGVTS